MSVEVLLENIFVETGEGPHWQENTQTLYFIDNLGKRLFRWNYGTKEVEKIQLQKTLGFIVPRKRGGFVIGYGKTISSIDWNSKEVQLMAEVDQDVATRMNDGKCDAIGRLWFVIQNMNEDTKSRIVQNNKMSLFFKSAVGVTQGTMGIDRLPAMPEKEQGSLYCMDIDGTVRKHIEKVSISNGLAWSSDNKHMYFIDSIPGKVYGLDYNLDTGTLSNKRTVIDFEALGNLGLPDGMTIDREDKIWVACYDGAKVVRFDPKTGEQLQTIEFPAKRITSCCFGGPNYDELFITCGRSGASEQELKDYPQSGSLFRVKGLGVKGTKANEYSG